MRDWTVDEEEAIRRFRCKKCGKRKGEPCVYLPPPNYTGTALTPRGRAAAAKIGTEMISIHQERRDTLHRARLAERQAKRLEEARATSPPWLPALRQFDADEVEAMRVFLRAHALRLFRLRRLP
jgi:hypothetical protein